MKVKMTETEQNKGFNLVIEVKPGVLDGLREVIRELNERNINIQNRYDQRLVRLPDGADIFGEWYIEGNDYAL